MASLTQDGEATRLCLAASQTADEEGAGLQRGLQYRQFPVEIVVQQYERSLTVLCMFCHESQVAPYQGQPGSGGKRRKKMPLKTLAKKQYLRVGEKSGGETRTLPSNGGIALFSVQGLACTVVMQQDSSSRRTQFQKPGQNAGVTDDMQVQPNAATAWQDDIEPGRSLSVTTKAVTPLCHGMAGFTDNTGLDAATRHHADIVTVIAYGHQGAQGT